LFFHAIGEFKPLHDQPDELLEYAMHLRRGDEVPSLQLDDRVREVIGESLIDEPP